MKKISCLLFFALMAATFARGAESLTKPRDAYAQAVANYVEGANREIVALHAQVDAALKAAPGEAKASWEAVDHQLDECDRLIERLTSATRSTFDKFKSAYEEQRGDALKALAALKKT
jgi:hypothetical protein